LQQFTSVSNLQQHLNTLREQGLVIGFVPTMGALHGGHLALVESAQKNCDIVVVTIFVNPTQFNNEGDLSNYPKRTSEDLELLQSANCDIVFMPSREEVYPKDKPKFTIDLGRIATVLEGTYRPGHFRGVVNVVARFFEIIQPHYAYFGQKDFQQVAVVEKLANDLEFDVSIVPVPTKRLSNGLAMSSRNYRLTDADKQNASIIYKTLLKGREWAEKYSPAVTRQRMEAYFNTGKLELEYLRIVHPQSMEELQHYWVDGAIAGIAAYCGEVRLIDNMKLS